MEEDPETSNDTSDHHGGLIQKDKKAGQQMNSIMVEATRRFIGEIRESDIYKEYDYQRTRIKEQPELFERIQDYRQKNFELQAGAQGDELFDKIVAFEQEYEKFRENPLVDDFLRAELAFCRMIQEINVQIAEELEFE